MRNQTRDLIFLIEFSFGPCPCPCPKIIFYIILFLYYKQFFIIGQGQSWNIEDLDIQGLKCPYYLLEQVHLVAQTIFSSSGAKTEVNEAKELVDIGPDAGVNFFDTADVYSLGASEEILGKALKGKRDRALISTKATFTVGDGPNDKGSSRYHLYPSLRG